MQLTSEVRRLHRRYMALNTEHRFSAYRLDDAQGEVIGYVEECVFTPDTLRLRGWTMSQALALDVG